MNYQAIIYIVIALICSSCIAFTMTPIARVIAYKIGAVDVPKDKRRMHKVAMPLLGGIAIFTAFVIAVVAFCDLNENTKAISGLLLGALFIVFTGILDDRFNLNPFLKLAMQIVAACIVAFFGVTIDKIGIFQSNGEMYSLGKLSIPFTIIWIVAVTNAVNLIDGLDGLSCGISAISAFSILIASFFMPDNPAKIFMGDTGAMFLGFALSVISILGVFKTTAVISYWVPFIAFAVPLGDTTFAFIRRILHGKNPFSADRGHIHHKLIDMGFNQRQSVTILYAISLIFGIAAVLFAIKHPLGGIIIILSAVIMLFINWKFITKSDTTRQETGLGLDHLQLQGYENNVLSPDESVTNTRTDVADSQINSDLQDKEKNSD